MDLLPIDVEIFSDSDSDDNDYEFVERRPYTLRTRVDHFNIWDDTNFFKRFRLEKQTVIRLLQWIQNQLAVTRNHSRALLPIGQLLLTLRFYTTGSFLQTCGDFSGVSINTASRIVRKVSIIVASLCPEFIRMPTNEEEIHNIQLRFLDMHGFSRVIGCIDCTHIKIQSPEGDNAEYFRNRKGYFSLKVQAVCDSNMKIIYIVARWHGSCYDSSIFTHCNLCRRFERNEFGNALLLGVSG